MKNAGEERAGPQLLQRRRREQRNHMEKIRLIYGTQNAGKLAVMRKYLKNIEELEIIGLSDLDFDWEEPEESGSRPLDNAVQKAMCYYKTCRMPVFSADSGLYIEGLSAEEQPGVHVRRVGGKHLNDEQMRAHYKGIAARLGGSCTAQYRNAMCLVFSEDEIYQSDAPDLSNGSFLLTTDERPQKLKGFPLDCISADRETGIHYYDWVDRVETEDVGRGCERFFREVLAIHRERMEKGQN